MPGIKRDYNAIRWYLRKYAPAPLVVPLILIAKHHKGEDRMIKFKQYIDELIDKGAIDLKEVYEKMGAK